MNEIDKVRQILEINYDKNISDKIIESYLEIEQNYFLKKWKPSELDAGHFVESVRRLIEFEMNNGIYTSFTDKISNFSDATLKTYEQATSINESFRILIPRILKSVYNIRNKRGVGHIKDISPNEMDATLILYNIKWILSEIIRLKSSLSIDATQNLIDKIVERNIGIIWQEDNIVRILNSKIPTREQILILLYNFNKKNIDELRDIIEYKNKSNFKSLVQKLHSDRLIEFKSTGECLITSKGKIFSEIVIKKHT